MNIEKIVLDVLEENETIMSEFDISSSPLVKDINHIKECDYDNIAKSISDKIKPAKTLNRKEVEKIIHRLISMIGQLVICGDTKFQNVPNKDKAIIKEVDKYIKVNEFITQICNLPIEEGDE